MSVEVRHGGPADGMTPGALLRLHRERAGLSQERLAELAEMGVRTVRDLELGLVRLPHPRSVRRLAEALGLEGEPLARFEAVARRERWARRDWAKSALPAQLPPDLADFTGRSADLELIRDFLLGRDRRLRASTAAPICVISGSGGMGKTALAVHAAHQLRSAFPDGQLFVNLRGAEARPLPPAEVLTRFLRALGLGEERLPLEAEERSTLLRQQLAGRRMLLVLDNALDERQLRPLLPGSSACGVLITSRVLLVGLEGARFINLDAFDERHALELLSKILGQERIATEPDAAPQIVRTCGYMPLAIRIACAKLVGRPRWPLAQLARSLADEQRRLDELSLGDLAVRASVGLSYRRLDREQRRVLQLLGLLEAHDFTAALAGAVLELPLEEAEELLERLVDERLLDIVTADAANGDDTRYGLHDLLRLYARERAEQERTDAERGAWVRRALSFWLTLAEAANEVLPCTSDVLCRAAAPRLRVDQAAAAAVTADPLGWFEAEAPNLVKAVEQACALGLGELAWELAGNLVSFCVLQSRWEMWRRTHELALATARRAGNRRGEASMLAGLGKLKTDTHQAHLGQTELEQAVRAFRELGDLAAEARALHELASAQHLSGDDRRATASAERAVALARQAGSVGGQADALFVLGQSSLGLGRLDEAEATLQEAAALHRRLGKPRGEAQALHQLAAGRDADGRPAEAIDLLHDCLRIVRDLVDRRGEARVLLDLGTCYLRCGDADSAASHLEACREVCTDLGELSFQAQALDALGGLHHAQGRLETAIECLELSSRLWAQLRDEPRRASILRRLAEVQAAAGERRDAAAAPLEGAQPAAGGA